MVGSATKAATRSFEENARTAATVESTTTEFLRIMDIVKALLFYARLDRCN
jgi:hypothetical protein